MFPTAALLVALRLGACPELYSDPVLNEYNWHSIQSKYCCDRLQPNTLAECVEAADHCDLSDATHQCCGKHEDHTGMASVCLSADKATCTPAQIAVITASNLISSQMKWCYPPPPASEELSSGAIGGIVVGAYLGVAAIGGAVAAYRGVAAGV